MADLDLIGEARIEVSTSGVAEANAGLTQLGAGVDGLVVKQDKLSAAQIRVNAALEATAKKYDAEYRAITELAKAQSLLERARQQGLSSTEAFSRVTDNVTLKLQAQAAAAKLANEAQQRLAATTREQAQASINATTGVRTDFGTAERAADIAAYIASLDSLREKFVPLFAIQQRYARQQAEVADAQKVGAITADEAAAANLRLTRSYEDQTQKLERLGQTQKESAQRSVNSQLIAPDRAGDVAAYGIELDRLQAKFDPLFRAEQAYITTVEELDRALAVGAVSTEVYNKAVAEQGAILDAAVAKISGVAEAQERAAAATKTAAAAQEEFNRLLNVRTDFNTEGRAADIEAYGRALGATQARYDPLYREQQKYTSGLQDLRAALAAGAISQDVFTARLAEQKAAFVEQANALGMYSNAQRQAAAAAAETARVAEAAAAKAKAQGAVNAQTITPDRAADVAAYAASLDELRAKFNPLFAAEQQHQAQVEAINQALKVGAISEKERTAAIATARATLLNQSNEIRKADDANARLTKGVGLNAYAWQNLSYQVNDVVTSLASGISPFQTLAQQGGQIYQILQSGQGGVGGALSAIKDRILAISPVVGTFGALAAGLTLAAFAAYRFVAAQRDIQLALLGAGQGAGVTADQIQAIAEKASRTSDITVSGAREIEKAFLQTGRVFGEVFEKGITAAENFGKATGQDRSKAAEFLATSLANLGSGGYEELAKRAGNFDAKLEDQVRSLLAAGKEMEAQVLVTDRFGQAFDTAKEKLTGLQRGLSSVDQYVKNLAESFGKAVSSFGSAPALDKQLENVESAIKNRRAIGQAGGVDIDTSDLDAKAAKIRAALKQVGDDSQRATETVRRNTDAAAKGAISAIVPEVASLEKIRQQAAEANKALNALESTPGTDPLRIEAAKKAVAGAAAAERDYAAAGGPANMERAKANEVLKAGLQALQARTPLEKAAAARQQELANSFGTTSSATERNARATDAYNKSLAESRQASVDQSRSMNEGTKTANELASATAKTSKSVEYLAAARKVDEQIAAGSIDKAERETKIREQLQSQLGALNQQTAERIRAAKDQGDVQQSLNDKVAAGTMVSAEAARRASTEAEISKLVREADAAQGEQKAILTQRVNELRAATEEQMSAEKRAQVLGLAEDEARRIALLQREAELLGQNVETRNRELAILQAKQGLERQGISTTSPESVAYLDKVALRSDIETAKAEYQRLAQDISSAVSGIFDDMFKAGNKGLSSFLDSFSRGFSRIGTRMIEQNLIAPILSGGTPSSSSSSLSFSDLSKAIETGSEKGFSAGWEQITRPRTNDKGQSLGFGSSPLGGALTSGAAGAAIGYQSQNPFMGAVGGGLAGFATAGPVGAVVGGVMGIIGGIFGDSAAKKQRQQAAREKLQQYVDEYNQALPQILNLRAGLQGRATTGNEQTIEATRAQVLQANLTASRAGQQGQADDIAREFWVYVARVRGQFIETFEGTLKEIQAGLGTSGPFSQAADQVRQLGETLLAFVADARGAAGDLTADRASAAAAEAALNSLNAPKTLSATATEFARIQGTAAALQTVLVQLGVSAGDAAEAIKSRTATALEALRAKFDDDVQRKVNDAQGQGYLNDAADLIKEVNSLRQDAGMVGGDQERVSTYFAAAAQKIVNGSELVGSAFDDLVRRFPELTGLVHEYSAALDDNAEALATRRQGYQDRLFAANNDTSTESGALAAFDRQAAQQRAAEVKAGNQAVTDLEAALAAERLGIIKDFAAKAAEAEEALANRVRGFDDRTFAASNDNSSLKGQLAAFERTAQQQRLDEIKAGGGAMASLEAALAAERLGIFKTYADAQAQAAQTAADDALKAAQANVESAQQALQQAYQEQQSTLNATISRLEASTTALRKFKDSLNLNAQLSVLSPAERLAEAQRQYQSTLSAAQNGDQDALDNLQASSQAYLEEAKSFYASSEDYYRVFARVQGDLSQTADTAQSQLDIARSQLNALDRITSGLINVNTSVLSVAAAVAALQSAQAALAAIPKATNPAGATGATLTDAAYVNQLYQSILGRSATGDPGSAMWTTQLANGASRASVLAGIVGSAEAKALGYANGGVVGNGVWNRDSVLARYAGGGSIALAGGEYVIPATQVTPATMPVLDSVRAGMMPAANTNSLSREDVAALARVFTQELRSQTGALRDELAAQREETRKATTAARLDGQKPQRKAS